MTLILASEPITVKRIIFRIQSRNFSKQQFSLSLSLFLSVCLSFALHTEHRSKRKNNNKIYGQKIAQVVLISLVSVLTSSRMTFL